MVSTDQGASNLYLNQKLAAGTLGVPDGYVGTYLYFTTFSGGDSLASSTSILATTLANGNLGNPTINKSNQNSLFTGATIFTGSGGGTSVTTYYKMRGFYVTGGVYESYVVTGSPSSTPPSGHTLIDVTIASTWQI